MKRIAACFLFFASLPQGALADKWVDDWFDSATYSGSSSFSGQNRHFMTGGSFAVRSRVKTDYPITLAMPKISAGCGGIDGFMGGFSFLDADYLVDKAQRMMQAAPYIAVDMALKTMSKEFSDTLKAAEDMVNALNGIQLNECSSMKPVVTAAWDKDAEGMKSALGEIVNAKQVRESTSRLWQEAKEAAADNDNEAPVDISSEVSGCPVDVREIFEGGSVIDRVAERTGMTDHADLIRGYFGDVVIRTEGNLITADSVNACAENQDNYEGFLYGDAFERSSSGACTRVTGRTVYEVIYEKMDALASKIESNQALNDEDKAFAGQGTRLPVFRMLIIGHEQGTLHETKQILTDITATSYASRVADTFYSDAYDVLKRVSDAAQNSTQAVGSKPCNMRVYAGASSKVRDVLNNIRVTRRQMNVGVGIAISEHTQFQMLVEESIRRMERNRKSDTVRFSGGNS